MTRKNWTLYTPFYSTDWPGGRRNNGSIVTVADFHRAAPMRQVFQYAREQFHARNHWTPQLNSESIKHAMSVCRRVYFMRLSN